MFIVAILKWWYGAGWYHQILGVRQHLIGTLDYFSIDLLARTLFSPFRQISAGKVNGPLGVQMRAFFDRLISRLIGAMVRASMILIGLVAIILSACAGTVIAMLWICVPVLPIIGVVLCAAGWMPWS